MLKQGLIILVLILFAFACKKKKDTEPTPEPVPEKTCALTIELQRYDSLGDLETDHSGVSVSLSLNGPVVSISGTTTASGILNFPNVPARIGVPNIFKSGYDGAPLMFDLTNSTSYTISGVPVAKVSPFKIQSFTGQFVNKDSITLSFTIDKSIPAGKLLKVAVLTGTNSGISSSNHFSADLIFLNTTTVNKYNIALLPSLKSKLNTLAYGTTFYITAIPVSYGLYQSNLYGGSVVLGDNNYYPSALSYVKNW